MASNFSTHLVKTPSQWSEDCFVNMLSWRDRLVSFVQEQRREGEWIYHVVFSQSISALDLLVALQFSQ